eukprot:scaffold51456_cov63-Phaeocystis_antarctica.AAC.4
MDTATRVSGPWLVEGIEWFRPLKNIAIQPAQRRGHALLLDDRAERQGQDCGLLLRILPEDAAKSGRRSDEDWAVVWDDCVRTGGLMPTVQNELVPLARAASGRRLCLVQLWIGGWSA